MEEAAGLFERDALMFHAAKRRTALDTQYEGLVFGRLDLDHGCSVRTAARRGQAGRRGGRRAPGPPTTARCATSGASGCATTTTSRSSSTGAPRPPRLLPRHADPADGRPPPPRAAQPRRDVIGIEDDLMVPEPPDDLVVVGDGALMAALTRAAASGCATSSRRSRPTRTRPSGRARGASPRSPAAGHGQDGRGAAPRRVPALLRAAPVRVRRHLVVGPSGAYTAYIERVLPSLGEDSVTLRALGDVIDVMHAERSRPGGRLKGSMRIRPAVRRVARTGARRPTSSGRWSRGGGAPRGRVLDRVRAQVLREHQPNTATVARPPSGGAWSSLGRRASVTRRPSSSTSWRITSTSRLMQGGGRRSTRARSCCGSPTRADAPSRPRLALRRGRGTAGGVVAAALETGTWSVADVALVDDSRGGSAR